MNAPGTGKMVGSVTTKPDWHHSFHIPVRNSLAVAEFYRHRKLYSPVAAITCPWNYVVCRDIISRRPIRVFVASPATAEASKYTKPVLLHRLERGYRTNHITEQSSYNKINVYPSVLVLASLA